jgi:hypothetical protein
MEIILNERWRVTIDRYNYTLGEYKPNKKGQAYWYNHSYYPDIKSLLKGLVDLEIMDKDLKDLNEVAARQEELKKMIKNFPDLMKNIFDRE